MTNTYIKTIQRRAKEDNTDSRANNLQKYNMHNLRKCVLGGIAALSMISGLAVYSTVKDKKVLAATGAASLVLYLSSLYQRSKAEEFSGSFKPAYDGLEIMARRPKTN